MSKKILLLNPPGEKLYIRDYYCSKVSKSNYLFHPIDLLMPSGVVSKNNEVFLIDSIADRLTPEKCMEKINEIDPDIIISLIGSVALEEDISFLQQLVQKDRLILLSGDAPMEAPNSWIERHSFVDAIIMDFTSDEITRFIDGQVEGLETIIHKGNKREKLQGIKRPLNEEFTITLPRHDLFKPIPYRFPFVRHKEFATVLTSYGCPFKCTFCIIGTVGYKHRSIGNVLAELKDVKRLGIKEIFFYDQTFGVNRKRCLSLCGAMEAEGFGFGWVCFSRVDVLDEETISAMKNAGCHTIIFGVESASEYILKKYQKGYTKEQIKHTFKICKQYKIRTVATFIIGLPEETRETAHETIEFLKEIDCDFASFNVAVPRNTTSLRKEALEAGLITSSFDSMDQTGSVIAMPTNHLSKEEVLSLKKKAVKSFYLRPRYLIKRLTSIRTLYELKEQVSEGIAMFRGL